MPFQIDRYIFESVWPDPSEPTRQDVIEFWRAEGALSVGAAAERASQLLVVCREKIDNHIAAVSTVLPHFLAQLELNCFYFRSYVGVKHRVRGIQASPLIQHLLLASYSELNQAHKSGRTSGEVGLYMEIQNQSILRHRRELVWNDRGANIVFVGKLPGGGHARIWYFEHATLPS